MCVWEAPRLVFFYFFLPFSTTLKHLTLYVRQTECLSQPGILAVIFERSQ
jgi:hypothetical protein